MLKYGGFYADLDTECRVPLDQYLADGTPSLVVGIENEFDSLDAAFARSYARQRQLVQWAFAAEPGHPALKQLADRVADLALHGTVLTTYNLASFSNTVGGGSGQCFFFSRTIG